MKALCWHSAEDVDVLAVLREMTAAPGVSMDDQTVRKVVDALRHGDTALTLTVAAKLAAAVDGVAPGAVGVAMKAVSVLRPAPTGPG